MLGMNVLTVTRALLAAARSPVTVTCRTFISCDTVSQFLSIIRLAESLERCQGRSVHRLTSAILWTGQHYATYFFAWAWTGSSLFLSFLS